MTVKSTTKSARMSEQTSKALEARSLQGHWDVATLLALLGEIDGWDTQIGVRKKRAKRIFLTGLWLTVISFFTAVIWLVVETSANVFVIVLGMVLASAAVAYWGHRLLDAAKSVDVPDEIRLTLLPVLRQLKQDLHPLKKVSVKLELACFDEKRCKTSRNLPPGRNKSLTQQLFEEPVGSVRMTLVDQSVVIIRIRNDYQKIMREYRGSSGKQKFKTKWKKITNVSCVVVPRSPSVSWDRNRAKRVIDPKLESLTFSERGGRTVAKLQRQYKGKSIENPPEEVFPPERVLKMLICLNTIRISKQTSLHPSAGGGAR